jgi:hypothetical protein
MKKIIVFTLALLMLTLCSCGKKPEPSPAPDVPHDDMPVVEEQIEPTEEADEVVPPAEEEPAPTETTAPPTEAPAGVIDTEFYTLTLPEEWIGKTLCDLHKRDNGSYSMSVHEIQDFSGWGGGTLFTLMMLPESEDYTIFPDYQLIGVLDTPVGTFTLIALFPTDVQFAEGHAEAYMDMFNNVNQVLQTIEAKDGIEMAMP